MSAPREGGISGLLPMTYRGRAEAFARHLHCRLRSLSSDLPNTNPQNAPTEDSSWLATQNPITTKISEKSNNVDSDIYYDYALNSPESPIEEITENELNKFITNETDNLASSDEPCQCVAKCLSRPCASDSGFTFTSPVTEDASETSDSSDYFDPENASIENLTSLNPDNKNNLLSVPSSGCNHISSQNGFTNGQPEKSICTDSFQNNEVSNNSDHPQSSVITNNDNESDCPNLSNGNKECRESEPVVYRCSINIKKELLIDCSEIAQDENGEIKCDENKITTENTDEDDIEIQEPIPRVRRCSSLKTGKTPPGTPGQKKIVRFADVLGLDLADVRTYLDEIPKIPTSAYEDLHDVDLSLTNSEPFCDDIDTILENSRGNSIFACQKPDKILLPLFPQPGGEADFIEKVKMRQCCLENACVQNTISLTVAGIVRVRNLDFHKSVHIRYSIDGWKTFSDLQATYVPNSCDGFSDKFSFLLYCHTLTVGQRIEFAVRFQAKGVQYWDNNLGLNYCFQCLSASSTNPYLPISSPEEPWGNTSFY